MKIGDVVMLKSGGPEMTVKDIVGKTCSSDMTYLYKQKGAIEGDIVCLWFEEKKTSTEIFKPDMLDKVEV